MYEDVRYGPRNDTPIRVTLMRALTVIVFLGVLLNVMNWHKSFETNRPALTPQEIQAAQTFARNLKDRAMAMDEQYTLTQFGADFSQIVGLSSALNRFAGSQLDHVPVVTGTTPAMIRLQEDVENTRVNLVWLVDRNLQMQQPGKELNLERMQLIAVGEYRAAHGGDDPWPVCLRPDPSPVEPINWHSVASRGIAGWLLAMALTLLTMALAFRLRRESFKAELILRPHVVLFHALIWPSGLWFYAAEPGIIEVRLQQAIEEFRRSHGHLTPDKSWVAAKRLQLMGRVRSVEEGLASIREYPELININSRRALFMGWLVATLSGPMQLMVSATHAFAQVAKAGADTAQVDTSRVQRCREISGRAFGIMSYARQRGFNLGTLLGTIHLRQHRVNTDAWVDFGTSEVLQASATVNVSDAVKVEGGRLWSPVGYCLPTPDVGLFPAGSLGSYFPKGLGDGVAVHADIGASSLVASAQSGLDPTRTDFDAYGNTKAGVLTLQAGGHTGSQQFAFGEVEIAKGGFLLREMAVTRPDRDRAAISTDIVYRTGMYRGGFHFEHDRWQASLERKLDALSRFILHVGQTNGVASTSVSARIQYGFALAP